MDQIRLTIITELYMREMGVQQFYESVGGSSYDSVRRHFLKLVDFGWLRYIRTASSGRGRPEKLYRSTELAVIDTETWRMLPFTVQLLLEMGGRVGEALQRGRADALSDLVASFKMIDVDELAWCEGYSAVERCFHTLMQKQTDARIRLEGSDEEPQLIVVNLAAFEAARPSSAATDGSALPLPKADETKAPPPWPERVGKVFSDRLDLAIVDELTRDAKTPAQLQETFGGTRSRPYRRRCQRLADLGWAVSIDTLTGGDLHGANTLHFRAAAPNVPESDIYRRVPRVVRSGRTWDTFRRFTETSIDAVDAGTFNGRTDRHLTMSPLLVDETGREQVAKALKTFEGDLLRMEDNLSRRRQSAKKFDNFPAGFLLSGFDAPMR
jgi:hypothetical protein